MSQDKDKDKSRLIGGLEKRDPKRSARNVTQKHSKPKAHKSRAVVL